MGDKVEKVEVVNEVRLAPLFNAKEAEHVLGIVFVSTGILGFFVLFPLSLITPFWSMPVLFILAGLFFLIYPKLSSR